MGKHQVQALQGPNLFIQFTPRALTKLHVRWWVKISTRKLRNFGGQFTSVRVGSPLFLTFYQQISPCKGLALGHLLFDHEYKPSGINPFLGNLLYLTLGPPSTSLSISTTWYHWKIIRHWSWLLQNFMKKKQVLCNRLLY